MCNSQFAGTVPNVLISSKETNIFAPDGCVTVKLNCTVDIASNSSLQWVHGEFEARPIPNQYTNMTIYQNLIVLTLDFSSNCAYLNITLEGTALFCLASNPLGTVRSRSVILLKPGN